MFKALEGYQPQKVTDGFDIIKENNMVAIVNSAMIEEYKGEKPDLKGVRFFRYELEIVKSMGAQGRKLWKSYRLDDEKSCRALADMMFTLGLEFKDEESLTAAAEKFAAMNVKVKAWGWKPDDKEEARQMHMIKGEGSLEDAADLKAPF